MWKTRVRARALDIKRVAINNRLDKFRKRLIEDTREERSVGTLFMKLAVACNNFT